MEKNTLMVDAQNITSETSVFRKPFMNDFHFPYFFTGNHLLPFDLNIIYVNYRMKDDILLSLQSLLGDISKSSYSIHIQVMDNSDNIDGIALALKEQFPAVQYTKMEKNLGFGHATNLGIAQAYQSRYHCALNPDTLIPENSATIDGLIRYMDTHPQVGVAAPKILNMDGSLQYSCFRFNLSSILTKPFRQLTWYKKFRVFSDAVDHYLMADFDHGENRPVDWVMGSAMIISGQAIKKIGGFDTRYFMYFEDCDLCHRMWNHGYEVHYAHDIAIKHRHGRESAKVPGIIRALCINSMARVHTKSWFSYLWKWRKRHVSAAKERISSKIPNAIRENPTSKNRSDELHPKIAIIYLSYRCEPYLDDFISSIKQLNYPKNRMELIIVDNPHPEFGSSMRALEQHVLPLSGNALPQVTLLPQKENLGFAAGNSVGISLALKHGCDFVFLHNADGFLASTALLPLVEAFRSDPKIGAVQSLLLLHPETEKINSAGNSFHYMGFGYCNEYLTPLAEKKFPHIMDIGYASGAAVMLRSDLIRSFGPLDDDFFMYHEDIEYSLRLRLTGYRIVLASQSVFYHKYQFARSMEKFFWMERNRYAILLLYYKIPTLLLLLPMHMILEIGLWIFAFRGKWMRLKMQVYGFWLKPRNIIFWLEKRKKIQKLRCVPDGRLLQSATDEIRFQDSRVDSPLLRYFGNPFMRWYYRVLKFLIRW
ncbi:MAG: glycosyltransferase [Parcubacteria group bacterium]|nr:glycosyltransferase [Parcubacteria group bacterium]